MQQTSYDSPPGAALRSGRRNADGRANARRPGSSSQLTTSQPPFLIWRTTHARPASSAATRRSADAAYIAAGAARDRGRRPRRRARAAPRRRGQVGVRRQLARAVRHAQLVERGALDLPDALARQAVGRADLRQVPGRPPVQPEARRDDVALAGPEALGEHLGQRVARERRVRVPLGRLRLVGEQVRRARREALGRARALARAAPQQGARVERRLRRAPRARARGPTTCVINAQRGRDVLVVGVARLRACRILGSLCGARGPRGTHRSTSRASSPKNDVVKSLRT